MFKGYKERRPIKNFLTSASRHPVKVSTVYTSNQVLLASISGGWDRGRKGLWGLSPEHWRDLHGGKRRLMGEAHFSARWRQYD